MDKQTTKEAIIAEYLAGGTSYRKLSERYGIKHQTIHGWVLSYHGRRKEQIRETTSKTRAQKISCFTNHLQLFFYFRGKFI